MTDGAIFKEHESKEALCRSLNDDGRGYRQPTDHELSVLLTLLLLQQVHDTVLFPAR